MGRGGTSGEKTGENNRMLRSMIISLLLVVVAVLFVAGTHFFMNRYHGEVGEGSSQTQENTSQIAQEEEFLNVDPEYVGGYLMVKNIPEQGFYTTKEPGKKDTNSKALENGQILQVKAKGTREKNTYYELKNGWFVEECEYVEPLKSYTELEGYLAITYISSKGVKIRSWADFEADNVEKTVYVGDMVPIKGKVTTEDEVSAYVTEDGGYITTDTHYLNDYTNVPEESSRAPEKQPDVAEESTGVKEKMQ